MTHEKRSTLTMFLSGQGCICFLCIFWVAGGTRWRLTLVNIEMFITVGILIQELSLSFNLTFSQRWISLDLDVVLLSILSLQVTAASVML